MLILWAVWIAAFSFWTFSTVQHWRTREGAWLVCMLASTFVMVGSAAAKVAISFSH